MSFIFRGPTIDLPLLPWQQNLASVQRLRLHNYLPNGAR